MDGQGGKQYSPTQLFCMQVDESKLNKEIKFRKMKRFASTMEAEAGKHALCLNSN